MAVASPCTNVCVLDPVTGYCRGCLRTVDEITKWGGADDNWKRAITELLKSRTIRKG